jgi:WD40 repeat protein
MEYCLTFDMERGEAWGPCVAFTPDGTRLLATTFRTKVPLVYIANMEDGRIETRKVADGPGVLAISPDGKRACWPRWNGGFADVYDIDKWRRLGEVGGHDAHIKGIAFSHDGRVIATASPSGEIVFSDAVRLERLAAIPCPWCRLGKVSFSRDGRWFMACGDLQNEPRKVSSIRVWRLTSDSDSEKTPESVEDVDSSVQLAPDSELAPIPVDDSRPMASTSLPPEKTTRFVYGRSNDTTTSSASPKTYRPAGRGLRTGNRDDISDCSPIPRATERSRACVRGAEAITASTGESSP